MSSLETYEKAIELIAVGEDLQNNLRFALRQAFENPKSYYDESGEYIPADRGMNYSSFGDLTTKMVLVDKMIEAGQMAEVDWKESEEEIRLWINHILKTKNYPFQIAEDDLYEGKSTDTVINSINDNELKPQGFALETLDIGSDSYVFTIVPQAVQNTVANLFRKL